MIELDEGALAAADAAGWLHPSHQALVHQQDWLRMLAPRAVGGGELPLPEVVRLEERIAAADGSLGWVVTLCAGAGWFAGFLDPALAREILATPNVCIAGSGAPTGYANVQDDGFAITGRWEYASGAPMATHFTLNAILRADGEVLRDDEGQPSIRAFIVPAALVTHEASWGTTGMRASASHAYHLHGARVPASHGFAIDAAHATADGPLYRFPFMALAYVTLAANLLGMAGRFVALALPLMAQRRQHSTGVPVIEVASVARLVENLQTTLATDRAAFYAALDQGWEDVLCETPPDAAALKDTSLRLVATCRAAVDCLYPYCGLQAARDDTAINRVWRDFHTATQHLLLLPD
ncbi:alkylation response protein AidB-like acyl-CoA dehydrogenase [Pseudoduganella lurida]|uniref:Alkylation response protein AidB-like acyl-CoA dehydrogenase n=1 Tax=Pseudoduganella lurida TaxID=1036180 RepID=A0A562RBV3_9BURK|nr:acyl-CoA dehydrogenase [Pseudoduganella lurida]TWI66542.1 alkylation response protein AidB-like acyl-CoA dehydrogenase [Pseudoduganella lurida]